MKPIFDVQNLVHDDSDIILVWEAIVSAAVRARISDIHVLAQKRGVDLVFRADGEMRLQGTLPHEFARRMINHIKTLSKIDLTEYRRPGEGRMLMTLDGKNVDLRVCVLPTIHGQDAVVRVFDRSISLMSLDDLGLLPEQLNYAEDLIKRPHGLILVCGATGSGKTTSLYAMLNRLTGTGRKVMTIEDPVEYELEGVNQTQVNSRIGVLFPTLLAAILRQDPDVIMIGEIRDEETAVTAVRAANTGSLVLATTHATRASRAVETMLGLGVHPYFLAVSLRGVMAQLLVKRICPHCRQALPATQDIIVDPEITARLRADNVEPQLYFGAGCEQCSGTGYLGRLGLFELFRPDDAIKQLILDRRPAAEIDRVAEAGHMLTLEQSGKLAALKGLTTMEEIVDALPMDMDSTQIAAPPPVPVPEKDAGMPRRPGAEKVRRVSKPIKIRKVGRRAKA